MVNYSKKEKKGKHMATRSSKKKSDKKPIQAMKEMPRPVEADTGEDLYVIVGGVRHQFSSQISKIYDVKEFFYKGTFKKGESIRFCHADGNEVPVHDTPNCGYTLVGKAQRLLASKKALLANGEAGDDQEYVYINDHSELNFVGPTGEHTLFVRVYDNLNGINNDRWVVIYME